MKDFQLNSMCSFFFPTQGPNKAHTLLQPELEEGSCDRELSVQGHYRVTVTDAGFCFHKENKVSP